MLNFCALMLRPGKSSDLPARPLARCFTNSAYKPAISARSFGRCAQHRSMAERVKASHVAGIAGRLPLKKARKTSL